MPGRKYVLTLLKLSESFTSKIILKFLHRHSPSTCKYCTNTPEVNEDCHDLITLKEELSALPACIRNSMFYKVMSATGSACNSLTYFYFLRILFKDEDLRINYESNGGPKDLLFFSRLSKNVITFTCKLRRVNVLALKKNFTAATNLQSVEFENLNEKILDVIGKCCYQLKYIKGVFRPTWDRGIYNSALEKLVFKDRKTQLQKNNCCHTLESYDVATVDYSDEELIEQIGILVHNVPNLKKIGNQNKLENVIEALKPENQTPLKLETIDCALLNLEMIETVKTYFPGLKILTLNSEQPLNVLQALSTISSITKLILLYTLVTEDLYQGILHSEWSNLHCLLLFGEMDVMNVSVFASKLPCLKILRITSCVSVIWNGWFHFNNLEMTHVEVNDLETNFSGIRCFSKTINWLKLTMKSDECVSVIPELLDVVFPKLKTLIVSPSRSYNIESVKNVLKNCPELKSFTCLLGGKTDTEYRRIADYLEENNIDCTVE